MQRVVEELSAEPFPALACELCQRARKTLDLAAVQLALLAAKRHQDEVRQANDPLPALQVEQRPHQLAME